MRKASRRARADDTSGLISARLEYVAHLMGPLDPPMSSRKKTQDCWGFMHIMLVFLLIPLDYVEPFKEDPEVYVFFSDEVSPNCYFLDFV